MPINRIDSAGSLYVVRLKDSNTVGVIGKIQLRSTQGRPSPPPPFNGFVTAYTPFGNGHVLALSLGGSDEPRNLVPQWEQWQQTGAWRAVETGCEQHGGKLFRCDVDYDDAAMDQHATLASAFAADPLTDWSDPRLPTAFRVRVYATNVDARMRAVATDGDFDGLAGDLDRLQVVFDSGPLNHRQMPAEDVRYWQDEVLRRLSEQQYQAFQGEEQARVQGQGQVLVSTMDFTNFLLHPDTRSSMQSALRAMTGFSPPEIANLQVNRLLNATHRIKQKAIDRYRKLFHRDFDDGRKKRHEATLARQKNDREAAIQRRRGLL